MPTYLKYKNMFFFFRFQVVFGSGIFFQLSRIRNIFSAEPDPVKKMSDPHVWYKAFKGMVAHARSCGCL